MNNWRNIKRVEPDHNVETLRVRYKYCELAHCHMYQGLPLVNIYNLPGITRVGVDIVHIDPVFAFGDPFSEGFRWSDLKGDFQEITHWMYEFDDYEECEEDFLLDYNGDDVMKNNEKQSFFKEVTVNKFNLNYFRKGVAYLLTSTTHHMKFAALFADGDENIIRFHTSEQGVETIHASDACNWSIEEMPLPFTDEEISYIKSALDDYVDEFLPRCRVAELKSAIIEKLHG